jgi:hypothetical protein
VRGARLGGGGGRGGGRGAPPPRPELERASAIAWDNDVLHYNLGLIYWRNGLLDRALAAFERSNQINPRHLASNDRVRPIDRVLELRAEVDRLRRLEESLDPALARAGAAAPSAIERHLRLAALLEQRGELLAARGHRLRASELGG